MDMKSKARKKRCTSLTRRYMASNKLHELGIVRLILTFRIQVFRKVLMNQHFIL